MAGAAHLEHVRAARRVGEQIHDPRRVEPERAAERERLAERLPIDHQRHVDGELHDRAGADRPAMLEPAAELLEDRLGRARRRRARRPSARSACPAAPDRSSRRPGIRPGRRLSRAPCRRARPAVCGCTVLISMNSLPRTSPASSPDGAVVDRVDRGGIGEDGDDGFGACASSAGVAATAAPASVTGFSLSAERFHTVTLCPTSISRCAMAAPILPIPAIPICIDRALCRSAAGNGGDDRRLCGGEKDGVRRRPLHAT